MDLPVLLQGGGEGLDVGRRRLEGTDGAQLGLVAGGQDKTSGLIDDSAGRGGGVLRVERHEGDPAAAGLHELTHDAAQGRLPVAHGDTDLDRFAELFLDQLALALAVVHERGARAAGLLAGAPDGGVLRRRRARSHPQDDAFQDGAPQEGVHLDDPAIGEELPQEGPDGSGRGGRWRAEVGQDEGGALVRATRVGGGGAQGHGGPWEGEGSLSTTKVLSDVGLTLAERVRPPARNESAPRRLELAGREGDWGDEVSGRRRSPGCARRSRRRAAPPAGPSQASRSV